MPHHFKKATRERIPLLIGLVGGTGSGKTKTALELAMGIVGHERFVVLDTEKGRAKEYSEDYDFDYEQLHEPYTPRAYWDIINDADKANYPCIVMDSMSHEWAGPGGVIDMQEDELERMAGQDWEKRERVKMASWIRPKTQHKKMVQRLLQVNAHLILCFRAEKKIEMVKDPVTKKLEIVEMKTNTGKDGWVPITEKSFPFELTTSLLFLESNPGVPLPIKLNQNFRPLVPLDRPITAAVGVKMAEWARGGKAGEPSRLTSNEIESLLKSLDVQTFDKLEEKYAAAREVCRARNDRDARDKVRGHYETIKKSMAEEGLITSLKDQDF